MQMHTQYTLKGSEEARKGRKTLCLSFSCLAIKHEFYFITPVHIRTHVLSLHS